MVYNILYVCIWYTYVHIWTHTHEVRITSHMNGLWMINNTNCPPGYIPNCIHPNKTWVSTLLRCSTLNLRTSLGKAKIIEPARIQGLVYMLKYHMCCYLKLSIWFSLYPTNSFFVDGLFILKVVRCQF